MADPEGIAFAPTAATLGTAPTWVRLDDPAQTGWRVNGYTIDRGRSSELDRIEPGRATVRISDLDGSFDPTNTGGPFFGNLDPMKQAAIVITNPITLEDRHLFRGFISEWPCDVDKTGRLGEIQLELVDGMEFLASVEMMPGPTVSTPYFGTTTPAEAINDIYFAPTSGTAQVRGRINKVLDQCSWPSSWRHVFSGNIDLQDVVYARREQALSAIQDAADAEFPGVANFFMSRRGTAVFRGRYARFDPESYISTDDDDLRTGPAGQGGRLWFWSAGGRAQAEAGAGTVAYISELAWRRSKFDVINNAYATPKTAPALGDAAGYTFTDSDIAQLLYKDQTSIDAYGWRSGPAMEDLLVLEGNTPPGSVDPVTETKRYSEYYVENYKAPLTRLTTLNFRGLPLSDVCAEATWGLICGVELGDVIHVETSHWDGAGGFDEDYFVEGIRYECAPAQPGVPNITCSLDVSPRGFYSHNPWGTVVPGDDSDTEWVPE